MNGRPISKDPNVSQIQTSPTTCYTYILFFYKSHNGATYRPESITQKYVEHSSDQIITKKKKPPSGVTHAMKMKNQSSFWTTIVGNRSLEKRGGRKRMNAKRIKMP